METRIRIESEIARLLIPPVGLFSLVSSDRLVFLPHCLAHRLFCSALLDHLFAGNDFLTVGLFLSFFLFPWPFLGRIATMKMHNETTTVPLITIEDYQGPTSSGFFKWMPDENGQMRPVTRLKEKTLDRPGMWEKAYKGDDE